MVHLFRNAKVSVTFQDYPPNNSLDRSLFDQPAYNRILSDGIELSPVKIIHCSAVHYQSRYRNSPSQRFLNAFFEAKQSFHSNSSDRLLRLRNGQSAELRKSSSEVLAVGLCTALSRELFDIPLNRILVIEHAGKRADFVFEKNSRKYILESKGREHLNQVGAAVKDVFLKKAATPAGAKYGFVSHLPRNGDPVSTLVVDPEFTPQDSTREDLIIRLLGYYAKATRLIGFWRLANLLNARIDRLISGAAISDLEGVALDYENVFKIGRGYTISYRDLRIETFFPAQERIGFRDEVDNRIAFFSIDRTLLEILESQDFDRLLEYRFAVQSSSQIETNLGDFSANDDGTVFGVVSPQLFERR